MSVSIKYDIENEYREILHFRFSSKYLKRAKKKKNNATSNDRITMNKRRILKCMKMHQYAGHKTVDWITRNTLNLKRDFQ